MSPINQPMRNLDNHHVIIEANHFDNGIGMIGDQLEALRDDVRRLGESQAEAMAQALRSVLTDKETLAEMMGIVVEVAQRRAAETTGNAVGSMLKSLLTRWVIIGCIVIMVAKTAGVDVAAAVWRSLKGAP